MTESRTLQFESPRALQSLYANDIKLLKHLEDSLGVKVTTREGWMKLEGDPSRVDKAQQVFQQLEQARQRGIDIQKHEFSYTLQAVTEERDESLGDIVSTKIATSSRKPPVVARSANQRAYVEAIQKHDVVFGIGPAGTGKTYLAVAMAVAALKKEEKHWVFCRETWNKKSSRIYVRFMTHYVTWLSRKKWSGRSRGKRLK
jgi:phosphate starvation-inducible PhoH-like protein